jgi:hypothetical protein
LHWSASKRAHSSECASEEIMNAKWMTAAAVVMGSVSLAGSAGAQSTEPSATAGEKTTHELAPVDHAVELSVAAGYAQGFGNVQSGQPSLTDVATAGGAAEIGVGYRLIPQLSLGVYGSGGAFGRGDSVDSSANLYTATAGVEAAWHFLPSRTVDPWVSLGTGWRGYWISSNQGDASRHGLQLAKLRLGADYRLSQGVAISPVIGADMSLFLTEETSGASSWTSISSPNVNTFVFAGVQGRFDVPTGSPASNDVASR